MSPIPVNPTITLPVILTPSRGKARWEKIRNGRTEADLMGWIRENMTGDQLVPQWGQHNYPVWFTTEGPLKRPENLTRPEKEDLARLREYLMKVYGEWVTAASTPAITDASPQTGPDVNPNPPVTHRTRIPPRTEKWTEENIRQRIDALFAMNSKALKDAQQKEVSDYSLFKKNGRYAELAKDYLEHLRLTAYQLPLNRKEFYAIAIYSSERFKEMLAIARGNVLGNEQWDKGTVQDLWFLSHATVGIKKLSRLDKYSHWIRNLGKPQMVFEPEAGNFGYLRRDLQFTDDLIEKLFHISAYTEKNGDFYLVPGNDAAPPNTFTDKGMMSTTNSLEGVPPYCVDSNVVFFIRVNKKYRGRYAAIPLNTLSRLPLENEILWAPATPFKVIAIRDTRPLQPDTSDQATWRKGSRKWSATEKLWVYLEAPQHDTSPVSAASSRYTYADALRELPRINLLAYLYNICPMKRPDGKTYEYPSFSLLPGYEFIPGLPENSYGEIPQTEFYALLPKLFPGIWVGEGMLRPMVRKEYLAQLRKVLLLWLEKEKLRISSQFKDITVPQRFALTLYLSPLRGWIRACSGIQEPKEENQLSKEEKKSRLLYHWILQNVSSLFLTYAKPPAEVLPKNGEWLMEDINATDDWIATIRAALKDQASKPVVSYPPGLFTFHQSENALTITADEGSSAAIHPKITWKLEGADSIPSEEKIIFTNETPMAILLSPEAQFEVEGINDHDSRLLVSIRYKSVPSQTL